MTTTNNDILIVNRINQSHKILVDDLSEQLEDTDTIIIQRDSASYYITGEELLEGNFFDDDLFLVNRDDQSYHATGEYMREFLDTPHGATDARWT